MSGSNTPRSKKRVRQGLIDLMKDHQKGKSISLTAMRVLILIGVIDGYFPPEAAIFQHPRGVKKTSKYAESLEIPDEDEEVRQLREDILKKRSEHGNSNGN